VSALAINVSAGGHRGQMVASLFILFIERRQYRTVHFFTIKRPDMYMFLLSDVTSLHFLFIFSSFLSRYMVENVR